MGRGSPEVEKRLLAGSELADELTTPPPRATRKSFQGSLASKKNSARVFGLFAKLD